MYTLFALVNTMIFYHKNVENYFKLEVSYVQ